MGSSVDTVVLLMGAKESDINSRDFIDYFHDQAEPVEKTDAKPV